jgi:hypothetical protein
MATIASPGTPGSVHPIDAEARVKSALRASRKHLIRGRLGKQAVELAKHIERDQVKAVHHITDEIAAIVRGWYREARVAVWSGFDRLHIAEEEAQGRMEVAETRLAAERTEQRMEDWLDAVRAYKTAQRAMREWVETYFAQQAAVRGDR